MPILFRREFRVPRQFRDHRLPGLHNSILHLETDAKTGLAGIKQGQGSVTFVFDHELTGILGVWRHHSEIVLKRLDDGLRNALGRRRFLETFLFNLHFFPGVGELFGHGIAIGKRPLFVGFKIYIADKEETYKSTGRDLHQNHFAHVSILFFVDDRKST